MKVAIVYDRVNKWGGAESVLLTLHEMFPKAPLYTSVYNKYTADWADVFPNVYTSFLQKFPFLRTRHELLAPLMPLAFESFDFSSYDLVISVTSEAAKGIITKPGTSHVCYMLTPTRYLWSGYDEYFRGRTLKALSKPVVKYLKSWDTVAAQRPDKMIAISSEVQKRIKKYYGRDSEIVYPPVDINKFATNKSNFQLISEPDNKSGHEMLSETKSGKILNQVQKDRDDSYFLIVSRLVPYKKVELAVRAFNELEDKLVVVGTGSQEGHLKKIAKKNIELVGFVEENALMDYYKNAKAFIFPQIEDFGITVVEAQAVGVPVIAFRGGGALDTVIENKTGIFFEKQDVDSLADAILRFKKKNFVKESIIKNTQRFSKDVFMKSFNKVVNL